MAWLFAKFYYSCSRKQFGQLIQFSVRDVTVPADGEECDILSSLFGQSSNGLTQLPWKPFRWNSTEKTEQPELIAILRSDAIPREFAIYPGSWQGHNGNVAKQ